MYVQIFLNKCSREMRQSCDASDNLTRRFCAKPLIPSDLFLNARANAPLLYNTMNTVDFESVRVIN